jgi:hypothetical protein
LAGAAALCLALFGLAVLVFGLLFPSVAFAQFEWVETKTGYNTLQVSVRDQEVCVCEAYECGGEAEPVHIAFDGWLRRSYAIIKDPIAGDDPNWGRKVITETACVLKVEGDQITYTLTELKNDDSTGLAGKARLLLEIK